MKKENVEKAITIIVAAALGMYVGWTTYSALSKTKLVVIKDPVAIYANGTTMVIDNIGVFSYSGAVGIVSQKQLLEKLEIKGGE
jgi:hypothetical protein